MRSRGKSLVLVLLACLLLCAGCRKKEEIINIELPEDTLAPTAVLSPSPSPTPEPTPVPTETPNIGLSGVVVGGKGSYAVTASTPAPSAGTVQAVGPEDGGSDVFQWVYGGGTIPSLAPIIPPATVQTIAPEMTPTLSLAPVPTPEDIGDAALDEDELPLIPN